MSTSALPGYGGDGNSGTSWRSSFHRQSSRKRRVPCHGGRLHPKRCYRKTAVADSYHTNRTQKRTAAGHNLTQLAGRWALRATFPNGGKLYTVCLLRTGSAPRYLLIKRTPNRPGRCWSDVSFKWPARNELAGWWLICWWLLTEMADDATPHTWHQIFISVHDQGILGPLRPGDRYLKGRQTSGDVLPWRW